MVTCNVGKFYDSFILLCCVMCSFFHAAIRDEIKVVIDKSSRSATDAASANAKATIRRMTVT